MRTLLLVLVGAALVAALAHLVWLVRTESYRAAPLNEPFSFGSTEPQTYPLEVDRAEEYFIEVWLDTARLAAGPPPDTPRAPEGTDVRWRVETSDGLVAEGSATEFGPGTVTTRRQRGRVIGRVGLEPGRAYTLALEPAAGAAWLDEARPRVHVVINPAVYEVRLTRQAVSLVAAVALGLLFATLAISRAAARGDPPPDAA